MTSKVFLSRMAQGPYFPVLLGVAIFMLFFGLRPLDIGDISWLGKASDPLQAWIGWTCYRYSPWDFPPGLNYLYGADLHNSIVYTDSIPLLAIPLKLFSAFLPAIFQYQGWWLLCCIILQCFFAWKLVGLYTSSAAIKLLTTPLFCFFAIFLFRLNMHFTLTAQFLLLAAIYLCLAPFTSKLIYFWFFALATAVTIHAYIFIMVGALWTAFCIKCLVYRYISLGKLFCYIIVNIFGILFLALLCGYFAITPGGQGGFGFYKMNILSFFDSDNYSTFIPDIPSNAGEIEGYCYLGAGVFLLLCMSAPAFFTGKINFKRIAVQHWPLLVVLALLAIIAITNVIGIASLNFTAWAPQFLTPHLNNYFRASGRFIWPAAYLILLIGIVGVTRYYSHKMAIGILAIILAIQVIDAYPLWSKLGSKGNEAPFSGQAMSNFWHNPKIKKIIGAPFINMPEGWDKIGMLAASRKIPTSYIYVGRLDVKRAIQINDASSRNLLSKNIPEDTIYIVNEELYNIAKNNPDNLFISIIDGFRIIANPKLMKNFKF